MNAVLQVRFFSLLKSFVIGAFLVAGISLSAQTTYEWVGGNSAWTTAANWSSIPGGNPRTTPAVTDILLFNNGATNTVTAVPTQTIGQLLISNNTTITLQAATTNTLTITPGTGNTGLQVASGSSLSNTAASIMSITSTNSAQVIDISGTLTWLGGTFLASGNTLNISGTINQTTGTITSGAVAGTVVNLSGTWNQNSGTTTLLGGTISGTMNVLAGTLNMNNATYPTTITSLGIINHTGGTITGTAAGLSFASGSNYNYLATGALTIPVATWDTNSNVNITGITSAATIGGISTQSFGNFNYNCTSQGNVVASLNSTTSTVNFTVKGNFNVQSTGAGTGSLSFKTNTGAVTATVNGLFSVTGGTVNACTAATTALTLNLNGGYSQSGGTFNSSTANIACTINISGSFDQSGGVFTRTVGTTLTTIIFTGVGDFTISGGTHTNTLFNYNVAANGNLTLQNNLVLANSRSFTVAANGRLNFGTYNISGVTSTTFSVASGGTISLGDQLGITTSGATGNVQTNTRTFTVGANFIYAGTNGQVTGNALPVTNTGYIQIDLQDNSDQITFTNTAFSGLGVNVRLRSGSLANAITFTNTTNSILTYEGVAAQTTTDNEFPATNGPRSLVINNPNGVTLHAPRSTNTGPTNTFTLTSGTLNTTLTNILTVSNAIVGAVVGGSESSYVNGPLIRAINAAGQYNFPVGDGAVYGGYSMLTTAAASGVSLRTQFVNAASGGTAGLGLSSIEDYHWLVERTAGTTSVTYTPTLTISGLVVDSRVGYSKTITGAYENAGGTGIGASITAATSQTISTADQNAYYTIGTTGALSGTQTAYTTLTSIATALQTMIVTGNVIFELPTSYSGEPAYPVVFTQFAEDGSGPYNVTIRPETGSTNFLTAGTPGTGNPLINLNGIDRLTIDGRAGGSGSNVWTFRNTQTAATVGPTFQFINDATFNTLTYLTVEGQNITGSSGTILFSTAAGLSLGNSNNTISYCDIRENTATGTTPANGIYSLGTASIINSSNTITNNKIYNNFVAGIAGAGVWIGANNTNWTITDNHFYQTAARTGTGAVTRYAIYINNTGTGSDNYTIENNFIGGSEANALGDPYTITGTVAQSFHAIYVNVSTTATNTVISGNTIRNFTLGHGSTTATSVLFAGVYSNNGTQQIFDNTIGSTNGTNVITISSTGTSTSNHIYGIYIGAGVDTIYNNTIAGIRLPNTTGLSGITGIYLGSTGNAFVNNNTIRGLYSGYTSTGANQVRGIATSTSGINTITNNTIYDLTSSSGYTGTGTSAAVIGIHEVSTSSSTTATQTVSGNIIYDLSSIYSAGNSITVTGIHCSNPTSTTNLAPRINGNFVHSLSLSSTNVSSTIIGINALSGLGFYTNNMIRLGIDSAGAAITTPYLIYGIFNASGTAGNLFYYNSVYVGGTGVASGTNNTYSFYKSAANSSIDIRNNILINARSNAGGTAAHYAMGFAVLHTSSLTSNNNLFNTSGTGGAVGLMVTTPYTTLNDWQTGTSKDISSIYGVAGFINPTGNAASVDLHINTSNPTQVEGAADSSVGPNIDIDGDPRFGNVGYTGSGTNSDIGADEGEFIPQDATPPLIVYTSIPTQTSFVAPTLSATITDANAVDVATGFAPRIYFKRSTDANEFNNNTSGSDGWKYVESTTGSSPFSLTLDYTLLNGGTGVLGGDEIMYFVVAQDTSDNVAINSGDFAAAPSNIQLTGAAFPISGTVKSYIINVLSNTVTVGTGGDYLSLTNDGGLFQTINTGALSTDLEVEIISDLTSETGTHPLNQWTEILGSGYTLTIRPDAAVARTISGVYAGSLIRLDGADRTIIDGSFSGSGKYLIIANTNPTVSASSALQFLNEATNDTIRNCVLRASTTSGTNGVVVFGLSAAGTTGNSNNMIDNCDIHENGSALPANGIYSAGTAGRINSNNTISNNNIFNYFLNAATATAGINIGANTSAWTIIGNKFYQEATRALSTAPQPHSAIYINNTSGVNFTITDNIIGGNAADGTGTMTYNNTGASNFSAIHLLIGASPQSLVQNNTITNISYTTVSAGTSAQGSFSAIYLGASAGALVKGNTIGAASGTGAISVTVNTNNGGIINGIKSDASGANAVSIEDNIIGGMSATGTGTNNGINLYGIHFTAGNQLLVKSNLIGSASTANSMQVNGTASSNGSIMGGIYGVTSVTNVVNTIQDNTIYNLTNNNTGTASRVFGVYGTFSSNSNRYYVTGNTVRDLKTTASTSTGTGVSASVIGVGISTTNGGELSVSGNTVHSLSNTGSANATVLGIYFSGGSSTSNGVEGNLVHSLTPATGSSANVIGIQYAAGAGTMRNNMVRLGIDAAGDDISQAHTLYGIDLASTSATNIYHNSVYIGGAVTGTTALNSNAFRRTAISGTINIQNNIFMNARTQSSGGKHYCIYTPNITTFTSNYNILYALGTGTYTGLFNTTDQATLNDWRTATTNRDLNSSACDPGFENATGDATDVDLHLNTATGTAAEGRGNPAALSPAVTLDFDGETRDTPAAGTVDVGADAGDYIGLAGPDLVADANGETTLATCQGNSVTFTVVATGGSVCGAWEYSWYNGSLYWDGSDFTSAIPVFNTAWDVIVVSAISTGGTYTAGAKCSGDTENCIATSFDTVVITLQTSPATLTSAIGIPANGLNHYIQLNWPSASGATSYEVEYSTNGSTWNSLYTGTDLSYNHNTGDSPNAPYYYRVRSVFGSQPCSWTEATNPIYTAADVPAVPALSNATPYTIDLTLQTETPVANPTSTTYSIRNATTNQFVQADGSLGATEVFQTQAAWGTVTVTGLIPNTNYCFYARAKNNDGDIREGVGSNVLPVETFTTNANFNTSGSAPTNVFWSPASCTTGGLVYSASGGCTDGYVGKTDATTTAFGCFLRTPEANCTGQTSAKIFFDVSHSYFATQPNDRIRMYMWADGEYKTLACTSIKIDGVEVGYVDGTVRSFSFSELRNCKSVEATFDLSTTVNKSNILFYIEPNNAYTTSNVFSVVLDNISVFGGAPTACFSTAPLILNGGYTVGTGGDFPSLTNNGGLFEAINMATLSGNVTATVISDLTSESGTHALNQWNESGAGNYTLKLRPSDDTNRAISGTYAGANAALAGLFRINGADRFIIDGRDPADLEAGGRHLTFSNLSATNSAFNSTFNFINDAVGDTLRYINIEGATTGATSSNINGVVRFSTASAGGNDNISVDNCHIRDVSGSLPVNAIYASGTAGQLNSGVSITNNEIYNFWGAGANPSNGILIASGNTDWTISGNSFYQTASRVGGGTIIHYGIQIDNSTNGNNFVVENNSIGGGAAGAAGTAWTVTGTAQVGFIGISLNIMTSATSLVQGNKVANFDINSTRVSAFPTNTFTGILSASNGAVTIDNNIIGSGTGNGSITINNASTNNATSVVAGIGHSTSTGDVNITNNVIGSFTLNSTSNYPVTFNGIRYAQGGSSSSRTISGNLIGSLTTANSINVNTGSNISAVQDVVGILMTGGANAVSITNNTIANLHNNRPSTNPGQIIGISSPFATNTITGNTIYNLTTTSNNTGTGASSAVAGIVLNATSASGHTISQNTIYALKKSSGTTANSIVGIYYGGSTGANSHVSRNLIHSLSSSATGALVSGIYMGAGSVTVSNNMIRLGLDETGADITTAITFQGIVKDNTSTNNFVYYNSVYIGGSGVVSTASPTYAFRRMQTNTNDNVRNNIFYNARSNDTTGGSHYGVFLNNSTTLVMSHNLIYTNGTGGLFGRIGTTDYATLSAWAATGFGTSTVSADPQFVAPAAATPDLNLITGSANPAESGADPIAGIEDDYTATGVRTGYPQSNTYGGGTAPDMGADETDMIPVDVTAPAVIINTAIPAQTTVCGTTLNLTVTATVTDGQSGVDTGSLAPTLWWRLSTGTYASLLPASVAGNVYTYNLTITGIDVGDIYEYYVAAQDLEGNIGYSHQDGSSPVHTDVSTTPSTLNGAPATFSVIDATPLFGTVTVGTSGDYTSLTKSDGLFRAIFDNGLSGDLRVEIISNTTEDGNFPLYNWAEYCGSNYRVTIVPNAATERVLSGSLMGMGLIPIYASRVTIDGRFNGSGRYLKFENTYTGTGGSENSTFRFGSGTALASSDTLRYCEVVGNTTKTAGAVVHMHNISGLVIENNLLHGGGSWAMNIIRSDASNTITIKNNEIYNFLGWSGGISTRSYGILVPSGNGSNWNIQDNSIYNTGINGQNVQTALAFNPGSSSSNNNIRRNWIGGSSAQCGTGGSVAFWGNSYTTTSCSEVRIIGIEANASQVLLDSNNVTNIYIQGCDYVGFVGMHIQGATAASVTNNVFGTGTDGQPDNTKIIRVAGGGCTTCAGPGYIYGIWNQSSSSTTTTYDKNDFYYLWQSGAYWGGAVQCLVHQAASPVIVTNNRINGAQAAGLGLANSFGIRIEPTANTSGNVIEDNMIAGPYINGGQNLGNDPSAYSANIGIGIRMLSSRTVSGSIARNVIWDMRNGEVGGYGATEGIFINGNGGGNGNWDILNNQITLKNNGSTANCVGLYGIDVQLNSSSSTNINYNTVYISGSNGGTGFTGADFSSYGYLRLPNGTGNTAGDAVSMRNNIFINWRLVSTTAVSGHYAIANLGTSNFSTNFNVSDYNFLAVADGTKSYMGVWGTTNQLTFANWKSASSKDANSYSATYTAGSSNFGSGVLNADNLFLNPLSDLHLNDADGQSYLFVSNRATPISLTTDFDGETRDSSTPDIGADEYSAPCVTPVITAEPLATQQVCVGGTPTNLTVTATGASSYQWFSNTTNSNTGGTNLGSGSGAQTATFTPPTSSAGTLYYYVEVTGTCPTPDVSAVATVTVIQSPAITVYIPLSFVNTICEGSSTSFGVTATGGGTLSYLWEVSTNGGGSWSTVANAAPYSGIGTNTLSISNTPVGLNGYLYRVTVTNSCSSVTSTNGTLNVNAAPAITAEPLETQSVCQSSSPSDLTVTATGYSLTYQWYSNTTDSNSGGTNLGSGSGAQTATFTPPTSTLGTTYYYVVVSSLCGEPLASEASEVIVAAPFSILTEPITTQTVCQNDDASEISVEADGGTLTYQWYSNTTDSNSGGTSLGAGAQSPFYTPSTSTAGTTYYYAVVTGGCGSPLVSETSEVIVNSTVAPSVSIAADPGSVICDGTSVTFTATPSNGGSSPVYQWKVNGNNVGTNSTTYTTSSLNNGDVVTCEMTGNAPCVTSGTVASNQITMTVNPEPEVYAGTDMTTCITVPITFANGALAEYTSSILWTHNGTGTLTNAGTLTPTYTAATGETSVTFTLTGNAIGLCDPGADVVVLTITSTTYYQDGDGDGFGNPSVSVAACSPPEGYVDNNLDFCDTNPVYNPNTQWWADLDGDGFGGFIFASGDLGGGCDNPMPGELVLIGGDCDDSNANVNPASPDICTNSIDDNCNGLVNENCSSVANDLPLQAITIPLSGNSYPNCGVITGSLTGAADSPESAGFTGSDVWYKFTALSSAVSITMSGAGQDNVLTLYDNTITLMSGNSTENVLGTGGTEILNYSGLTVGQLYYISVGAVSGTGSSFSICLKHLTASFCADGSGTYQLCSNLKAAFTGANTYTYNFTPTGTTGGSPTSITYSSGQLPLALASIAIRYGGTYLVRIDANYSSLTYGNGQTEDPITVQGIQTCNITIAPHAEMYTKESQQCPATVLRNSVITAKPFICGATGFTVEFTKVTDCTGATAIGFPFEVNTTGASPSRSLNFTVPQSITSQSYYRVRWRPNFSYGSGTFGLTNVIFVGGSASGEVDLLGQVMSNTKDFESGVRANLYPNPNKGELVNINLTDITSPDVFVRVMDSMGRVVYSNRFTADGSLNAMLTFARPLAGGIYMVEMTTGDEVITRRMIVER